MTPFEAGGRVDAAHDELSDLLEDPDAGNESIRDAAVRLCEALVADGGTTRPKSEVRFDQLEPGWLTRPWGQFKLIRHEGEGAIATVAGLLSVETLAAKTYPGAMNQCAAEQLVAQANAAPTLLAERDELRAALEAVEATLGALYYAPVRGASELETQTMLTAIETARDRARFRPRGERGGAVNRWHFWPKGTTGGSANPRFFVVYAKSATAALAVALVRDPSVNRVAWNIEAF